MNLVVIAAVIAVASAAKLDRTYLPPASTKTAGGNPGDLQTPFSSKSFNQGLGGIPKGGFENDFKGVVVDAAAPGTRASGDGETGLGAPRIAYGSTNSKVGDAAFRGSVAGFRQTPQNQFGNDIKQVGNQQNLIPDGQTAGTSVNAQSFVQGPSQFESNYQRSQELTTRDQNANIVRSDSDVGTENFSYSFETDNGISAEESGVATNGVQAQGGFRYTGDDGQVYSVTYTADEGGYQPKGDHLPTPPPIPDEILKSLEQNAREEAAGLVDDGSYDAQKYNDGGDYTENDGSSTHNSRQPAQFGNRPVSDVSASGSFINQNKQPFVRPHVNGQAEQTVQTNDGSPFANFGSSPNKFGQATSSSTALNGLGQANQAISNKFQQNIPSNAGPEDSENANTFDSPTFETNSQTGSSQNFIQGQTKPQQPSFGRPQSNPQTFNGQVATGSINNNSAFGPSSNNVNGFGQRQPTGSGNRFGSNEYLPPVNGINRRPSQSTSQKPHSSSFDATQQSFNQFAQKSTKPQDTSASSSTFVSGSQSKPEFGAFQDNQFASNQKPVGSSSSQNFGNVQSNIKPSFGGDQNNPTLSKASGSLPSFQPLQSTAQPSTELTTPFQSSSQSQRGNNQPSAFGSFSAQSSHNRPTQSPFGTQSKNNGVSQFVAPASTSTSAFASSSKLQGQNSRPLQSNNQASAIPNQRPQGASQFNQEHNFEQSLSPNAFSENQSNDAQFAPSTQRPVLNQYTQAQGPDDSYIYNQPSKIFSTPNTQAQVSRFPNTPFNQFNRVTQQPSFPSQSNVQPSTSQGNFPGNTFSQKNQPQGSSRYPQPPTLTSVGPTSPTQGSTFAFNGITQASASSFTSGAPTPSTQFGSQNSFSSFGRKPAQQIGQFNNQAFTQTASNQQGLGKQSTAQPQSTSNVNKNQFQQQNSFQNQQTTINGNQQLPNSDKSPSITSQQYNGEIYEYTKPAQTLPPPTEDDKKAGFGQFGRQPPKPQLGQQQTTQVSSDSQSGSTQGRPQSVSPSFGQKTQTSQQSQFNVQANSRPQFGQQITTFGNTQPTQASSFAQSTNVPSPQYQSNQFNAQANLNADQSGQQFGSRPFKNQPAQSSGQTKYQEESRPKNCCRNVPSTPQVQPSQTNQFRDQSPSQFGDSEVLVQGFKPDQASAQSFAGKGEVFGGPRKPPSFDEQTGYHY